MLFSFEQVSMSVSISVSIGSSANAPSSTTTAILLNVIDGLLNNDVDLTESLTANCLFITLEGVDQMMVDQTIQGINAVLNADNSETATWECASQYEICSTNHNHSFGYSFFNETGRTHWLPYERPLPSAKFHPAYSRNCYSARARKYGNIVYAIYLRSLGWTNGLSICIASWFMSNIRILHIFRPAE